MLSKEDLDFLFSNNPVTPENTKRGWDLCFRIYGDNKEKGCLEQYKNHQRLLKIKAIENER